MSSTTAPQNPQTSPLRDFSTAQLKLIRRTVARACTEAEFDEFIVVACQCGLDPLRRQITPLILSPDDMERRRLISWATIDGLRVIAARQGDYRPMETAPLIELDEGRSNADTNPLGIVRAEVRAWKASEKIWHPVTGEAWWDEYAPLREEWAPDASGRRVPSGKMVLEPSWRRMARVMIAKCAEAQALRRGWPDVLSGLYGEEELHAIRLAEKTASEVLRHADQDALRRQMNLRTLWFVFEPGGSFEPVGMDKVFGRLKHFYEAASSKTEIDRFNEINRASLQTLWEWAPSEALALKQMSEASRLTAPSNARPLRNDAAHGPSLKPNGSADDDPGARP
jgi:phage recombination protein Bet